MNQNLSFDRLTKDWPWLTTLSLLTLSSAAWDARLLFSYPVAVGTDGYYYVLQINELLRSGHLHFPSRTPLLFYGLAALTTLLRNPIIAIKVCSIILNVTLCVGMYALTSSITKSSRLGLLAFAIAAFSAMHFYFLSEFIKNLAGLTLLVWSCWGAIKATCTRRPKWIVISLAFFVAGCLSHESILSIGLVLLVLTLLVLAVTANRSIPFKVAVSVVIALMMILPAFIVSHRFVRLPSYVVGEVLAQPSWPFTLRGPLGVIEIFTVYLAAPVLLFLLIRQRSFLSTHRVGVVWGGVALWTILITMNPFLNHDVRQLGIIGRLDHMTYLQVAILLPGIIWLLSDISHIAARAVFVISIFVVLASMTSKLPNGLQPAYLGERTQMIDALAEQPNVLDDHATVIAQHGDEFVITFVLGIPAQQEFTNDQDTSVYWLLHQVNPMFMTPSMKVVMEEPTGTYLVLVRHGEITTWINAIGAEEQYRSYLHNPHLKKYFQ